MNRTQFKRLAVCLPAAVLLLVSMLVIHRNVYPYADDFYYIKNTVGRPFLNMSYIIRSNFTANGRVWVHVLLVLLLQKDLLPFRIVNPLVITGTALLISFAGIRGAEGRPGESGERSSGRRERVVRLLVCLAASLFFLMLPTRICSATLYYAACSLNYLYPSAVALAFGFLLYRGRGPRTDARERPRFPLLLLAFFAGSSTQQAGMIAIGFAVMLILYERRTGRKDAARRVLPCLIPLLAGYAIVCYGSVHRLLTERHAGSAFTPGHTLTLLGVTNIFSAPAAPYVILISLCSALWLLGGRESRRSEKLLAGVLLVSLCGYCWAVFFKGVEHSLRAQTASGITLLCFICFTAVYLLSVLLVAWRLLREGKPFPLFCVINAIGAQLMLVVADARFAAAYKIMFPSLLLMLVYLCSLLAELGRRRCCLLVSVCAASAVLAFLCFRFNDLGYRENGAAIAYNIRAIKEHTEGPLVLKRIPSARFGYNVTSWNDLPSFQRDAYGIDPSTVIEYEQ